MGEKHPLWAGDNVSIGQLHQWVRRHKPKVELCENCNLVPPIDLANISQHYRRDLNDFKWLCRKCHMLEDGRLKKFIDNSPVLRGEKSPRWNGGTPKCIDCQKRTNSGSYKAIRCRECYLKLKIRGKRGGYENYNVL